MLASLFRMDYLLHRLRSSSITTDEVQVFLSVVVVRRMVIDTIFLELVGFVLLALS